MGLCGVCGSGDEPDPSVVSCTALPVRLIFGALFLTRQHPAFEFLFSLDKLDHVDATTTARLAKAYECMIRIRCTYARGYVSVVTFGVTMS